MFVARCEPAKAGVDLRALGDLERSRARKRSTTAAEKSLEEALRPHFEVRTTFEAPLKFGGRVGPIAAESGRDLKDLEAFGSEDARADG